MGAIGVPGLRQATNWLTLVMGVGNAGVFQSALGLWRPPQWNTGIFSNQNQLYSLTVPAQQTGSSHRVLDSSSGNTSTTPTVSGQTKPTTYFFDAVLRAEHRQELRHTEHPIQSGSSITDHAYLMPARVTLEVGFSDCMARYKAGQYTSNSSKSISAYQTLLALQGSRVPLSLSTRLASYDNMVIESIGAVESYATKFSGRFSVVFTQIIVASLATQTVSARPDSTDVTNEGTKQSVPPPTPFDVTQALKGFPN
jgi:hypothetical protein